MLPEKNTGKTTEELSENANEYLEFIQLIIAKNRARKKNVADLEGIVSMDVSGNDSLKKAVQELILELDFTHAFTNTGIPTGNSFSDETLGIIKGKILPYVHEQKDARYVIRSLTKGSKVHAMLSSMFSTLPDNPLGFSTEEKENILQDLKIQIIKAIEVVSYRITALGMDDTILKRAGKDEALVTPFMEQNREVNELLTNIHNGHLDKISEDIAQCKVMLRQCDSNMVLINKGAEINGASLQQIFILSKLESLIDRISAMLDLVYYESTDKAFSDLSALIRLIVVEESHPKQLNYFISKNISLIAYRITENKRKTGEHYIAADRKEYMNLFISAMGGGQIVSFMVIAKALLHGLELPLLWESLAFSTLYAVGFVIIHILGFTLATKQPAMTAAFIAASLDEVGEESSRYRQFASLVATVFRSQFISFAGNLIIVFPLAICWTYILNDSIAYNVITEEDGADMLFAIHPGITPVFLYAAIAGAFLFLAGIISGYGDNKAVVSNIGIRLEGHPLLNKIFRKKRLSKIASYIEKNMGPLIGNIALGFFLGLAGFVGKITGLPFEIRHVTFSTGNLGVGLLETHFNWDWGFITCCLFGIALIGAFNFIFSFVPALQVAARSRNIRLGGYRPLLVAVWSYFKKHPLHFLFPPGSTVAATAEPTLAK